MSRPSRLNREKMRTMKRAVWALVAGVVWLAASSGGSAEELSRVKSLYLFPMSRAFDQYLAGQLTMQGVFEVVTDPQRADAILTDEIGQRFEKQFADTYPPPPPPPAPKAAEKKEGSEKGKADDKETAEVPELVGEVEPVPASTFGRGKGNLFIVSRESRRVLWSTYYRVKSSSAKDLNSAAEKIVGQLKAKLPVR